MRAVILKRMSEESVVHCVTDTLLPVCGSVYGSSGGLARAQRACFSQKSASLGVLNRLNSEVACGVRNSYTQLCLWQKMHNRALFRLAAELWPS